MQEMLKKLNDFSKYLSNLQNLSDAVLTELVQSIGISIARNASSFVSPIHRALRIYQILAPTIISLIGSIVGIGVIILPEFEKYNKDIEDLSEKIKKDLDPALIKIEAEITGKKSEENHCPKCGCKVEWKNPTWLCRSCAHQEAFEEAEHKTVIQKKHKKGTPRQV